MAKVKRYRLGFIGTFPTGHPKEGYPNGFIGSIKRAMYGNSCSDECIGYSHIGRCYVSSCEGKDGNKKLHTIRENYDKWENIMSEVNDGKAVIDLFYWNGEPCKSKQIVLATLDNDSGCGVQMLEFLNSNLSDPVCMSSECSPYLTRDMLAKNDGLSLEDFTSLFNNVDLSKPLAIIHFTNFRY